MFHRRNKLQGGQIRSNLTEAQRKALENGREYRSAVFRTRPELIRDPTPDSRVPRYLNEETDAFDL